MVTFAGSQFVFGIATIAVIGALVGAALYVLTIGRRANGHVAAIVEQMATADDPAGVLDAPVFGDPRLETAFGHLTDRMREAWTLATVDPLTGVLNRQALLDRLADELDRAARYQRPCSIALVDLDQFKRINDTFGHAAGDIVLKAVANVLRSNVRGPDTVGRYGGEEFMVVLPETDADAGATSAEKLRRLVGSLQVRIGGGHVITITLSAGVAGGLGQHLDLDRLIRDADAALYSAKSLGRDQVYVFHEVEESALVRRASIAPEAREEATRVGRAAVGAAADLLIDSLTGRPGWAGGPSTLIAEMAVGLARAVELSNSEVDRIRTASLLHDLGKLAIPDEILSNPGELSDPEWRVVSEHPKIGHVVLEQAGALRDAATIVLHHHEWYDGRGYPHGLSGEEIPVGARIVAIADAYEAMIAGRPYRRAITHQQAVQELRRHAGAQFDPELVRLFCALYERDAGLIAGLGDGARDHPQFHPVAADGRTHAAIHDALHARRRRATSVPPADDGEAIETGAELEGEAGAAAEPAAGEAAGVLAAGAVAAVEAEVAAGTTAAADPGTGAATPPAGPGVPRVGAPGGGPSLRTGTRG